MTPIKLNNGERMILVEKCREIIPCDTARIIQPLDKMYLVIGFNKNTKDDDGDWYKNGERFDFDYVQEKVVASGRTTDELIASAKEYKRLCGITMEQYINELKNNTSCTKR